jgi:hemolysin activation/secretion protein
VESAFSQKHVRENSSIIDLSQVDPGFDYSMLYDSLRALSSRVSVVGAIQYFIPWGGRSTVRLGMDAGAIKSGDIIFSNELFRLGGYARLRGFNEQSILAQYYSIFSAEYRLLMGGSSYVSLFTDYAWVKSDDVEFPYEDRPYGFGIGLNLETKAGIFGMRVAVGVQRNNPFNIDEARLHFGYVNRF